MPVTLLPDQLAICRLDRDAPVPAGHAGFWSITRTAEELSIVCSTADAPSGAICDAGWRALKLEGPFDLDAVGILAPLLSALAAVRVSVFVIATFDTDYMLVRRAAVEHAVAALERAGHAVAVTTNDQRPTTND